MEPAALQECLAAAERSFQEEHARAVGRFLQKQRRAFEEYYQLERVDGAAATKHDVIESGQARGGSQIARRPETKLSLQRLTKHLDASAVRSPRRSTSTFCPQRRCSQPSSETQSEESSKDEVLDQEGGELLAFEYTHASSLEYTRTNTLEDVVQTTRITPRNKVQRCLLPLVESRAFELFSMVVVVLMCVEMCVDTHYHMKDMFLEEGEYTRQLSYAGYANAFLVALFLIEMTLRIAAEQLDFFCGDNRAWNFFDLLLLSLTVIPRIVPDTERYMSCARIFRLARAIRLFEIFPDLRHMVWSIAACVQSMAWAVVLIMVLVLTFACYLMEVAMLYRDQMLEDKQGLKILRDEWSDMGYASRALVYSLTGGLSWGDLSRPFWRMSIAHGIAYTTFVTISIFGFLSILVGIFVRKTDDIRNRDRDGVLGRALESRRDDTGFFEQLFREIDTNGSGLIDEGDFANALRSCLRFQGAASTSDVVEVLQKAQNLDSKLTRLLGSHS